MDEVFALRWPSLHPVVAVFILVIFIANRFASLKDNWTIMNALRVGRSFVCRHCCDFDDGQTNVSLRPGVRLPYLKRVTDLCRFIVAFMLSNSSQFVTHIDFSFSYEFMAAADDIIPSLTISICMFTPTEPTTQCYFDVLFLCVFFFSPLLSMLLGCDRVDWIALEMGLPTPDRLSICRSMNSNYVEIGIKFFSFSFSSHFLFSVFFCSAIFFFILSFVISSISFSDFSTMFSAFRSVLTIGERDFNRDYFYRSVKIQSAGRWTQNRIPCVCVSAVNHH